MAEDTKRTKSLRKGSLRKGNGKTAELTQKYNVATGERYARRIKALIRKYYTNVSEAAIDAYVRNGNFAELTSEELLNRAGWSLDAMNQEIQQVASSFVISIGQQIDGSIRTGFTKVGRVVPPLRPTSQVMQNLITAQVGRIVELMDYQYARVNNVIQTAMVERKTLSKVKEELKESRIFSTSKLPKLYNGDVDKRIRWVASNQLTYATSMMWKERSEELGLFNHIWKHPPATRYKTKPRPDHVKAHGTIYDIRKGCKISGEYIQTGQLINCKCYSVVYLGEE
jgi:hypothetical protein